MKNLFKCLGIIALAAVIGFGVVSCGDGGSNPPPPPPPGDPFDKLPTAERWSSWANEGSTATITHEVDSEGVCKIIVGGTAMPPTDDGKGGVVAYWNSVWKTEAGYQYTAVAGKTYTYMFEAWTESGDRAMVVQWYTDNTLGTYQNTEYSENPLDPPPFTINSTRQLYAITGIEPIPKSGVQNLQFQCANQTGTFYVRIISIDDILPLTPVFLPQDGYLHSTGNYRIYCTLIRNGNQLPNAGVFTLQESTDEGLTWGDKIEGTYTFNTNTGKIGEISFVSNGGALAFTATLSNNGQSLSVYGITGGKEYLNGIWNTWYW